MGNFMLRNIVDSLEMGLEYYYNYSQKIRSHIVFILFQTVLHKIFDYIDFYIFIWLVMGSAYF